MQKVNELSKSEILQKITKKYLDSRDFNGYQPDKEEFFEYKNTIYDLVKEEILILNWGVPHPNPHILALEPLPVEDQLSWLEKQKIEDVEEERLEYFDNLDIIFSSLQCCLYPSRKHLKNVVSNRRFAGKPFTRKLALGMPQLTPIYFSSEVIHGYLHNPKYRIDTDSISGKLHTDDGTETFNDIFLEHFGFGMHKNLNEYKRCIVAFPYGLAKMDKFNQQHWNNFMLKNQDDYLAHPEYLKPVYGVWADNISIFDALLKEISVINQMTSLIYHEPLFESDYLNKKPKKFMYMLLPTLAEFDGFINTLSNITVDNINIKFFKKVGLETTIQGKDTAGNNISKNIGSINLLAKWLEKSVQISDPQPKNEMIKNLKELWRMRSKGGTHNEIEDKYDESLWEKQKDLITSIYESIRLIRLILQNHPLTQTVEIPKTLFQGNITIY